MWVCNSCPCWLQLVASSVTLRSGTITLVTDALSTWFTIPAMWSASTAAAQRLILTHFSRDVWAVGPQSQAARPLPVPLSHGQQRQWHRTTPEVCTTCNSVHCYACKIHQLILNCTSCSSVVQEPESARKVYSVVIAEWCSCIAAVRVC